MDQFGKFIEQAISETQFFCFQAQITNLEFDPTFHKYLDKILWKRKFVHCSELS